MTVFPGWGGHCDSIQMTRVEALGKRKLKPHELMFNCMRYKSLVVFLL